MKKIMQRNEITIYIAAGLFNARQCFFNSNLVNELEDLGYKTNLPQRDGFEFGNLHKSLEDKIDKNQIDSAVNDIIFYLDMGKFIPESNLILANLDETQDEGVLIELAHSKNLKKFNIGFRTDVRGPYGDNSKEYRGMHFFPVYYTLDKFISHYMPCKTIQDSKKQLKSLVTKIDDVIINNKDKLKSDNQEFRFNKYTTNSELLRIICFANSLFSDIPDLHSKKGLDEITDRYTKIHKEIKLNRPKIN